MPNYCFNWIEVSGPVKDLTKLVILVKGEDTALDFNKVIPYPKDWADADKAAEDRREERAKAAEKAGYKNSNDMPEKERKALFKKYPDLEDGYNKGGYTWCHDNWGTKWNVDAEIQGTPKDEEVTYTFDSAWSPPELVVKKLAKMFPTLNFHHHYEEPGMCFEGELIIKKGKITKAECRDMPTYVCNKCSNEQCESSEADCFNCWNCGGEDFTKKEEKDD